MAINLIVELPRRVHDQCHVAPRRERTSGHSGWDVGIAVTEAPVAADGEIHCPL